MAQWLEHWNSVEGVLGWRVIFSYALFLFVTAFIRTVHLLCVSYVLVAEWLPFGKELLLRFTLVMSICSSFLFMFQERESASDCSSSWSLLSFYLLDAYNGLFNFDSLVHLYNDLSKNHFQVAYKLLCVRN